VIMDQNEKPKKLYKVSITIQDLPGGKIDVSSRIRPTKLELNGPEDLTPALTIASWAVDYIEDLIKGARDMDQKTSEIILTDHFNKR